MDNLKLPNRFLRKLLPVLLVGVVILFAQMCWLVYDIMSMLGENGLLTKDISDDTNKNKNKNLDVYNNIDIYINLSAQKFHQNHRTIEPDVDVGFGISPDSSAVSSASASASFDIDSSMHGGNADGSSNNVNSISIRHEESLDVSAIAIEPGRTDPDDEGESEEEAELWTASKTISPEQESVTGKIETELEPETEEEAELESEDEAFTGSTTSPPTFPNTGDEAEALTGTKTSPPTLTNSGDSTSSSSEEETENKAPPVFIFHVGPGKTGTSTIQDRLRKSRKQLLADRYQYVGNGVGILKKTGSWVSNDLRDLLCRRNTAATEDFIAGDPRRQNNLIGSNEFLGLAGPSYRQEWVNLTATTTTMTPINNNNSFGCGDDAGGGWDVRVVVTYRRTFEMLPSRYNQDFKKMRYMGKKIDGHHDWPGVNGDYKIPTQPEYLNDALKNPDFDWDWAHPAYRDWGEAFPTSLFHFHQEGDMFTNFLCHSLPETGYCHKRAEAARLAAAAEAAEQRERENAEGTNSTTTTTTTVKKRIKNTSTRYVDHDILAVRAHEEGLVHASDNRFHLAEAVGLHWGKLVEEHGGEEIGNPFLPTVCPDGDLLEAIYNFAKLLETWALGILETQRQATTAEGAMTTSRYGEEGGNDEHTTGAPITVTDFDENWKKVLDGEKFCSIDAPAALQQTVWKEFFRTRRESFEPKTGTGGTAETKTTKKKEEKTKRRRRRRRRESRKKSFGFRDGALRPVQAGAIQAGFRDGASRPVKAE